MEVKDMRSTKEKWDAFKWNCREKAKETWKWIDENKGTLIVVMPFAIAVVKGTTKIVVKALTKKAAEKEIGFKERSVYDRSTGRYIELRRPMTNAEALEFDLRKSRGERTILILDDMRLLK